MKKIVQFLILAAAIALGSVAAFAGGSNPGLYYGQVPTAAQWNSYFSSKLDFTPGAVNTIPYWDGSGNQLNALISGDCTSAANVFTCTGASHLAYAASGAAAVNTTIPARLNMITGISPTTGAADANGNAAVNAFRNTTGVNGGTPGFVNASIWNTTLTGVGETAYEWGIVSVLNNHATAGENVAIYSQGNKFSGAGGTWASVSEARDKSGVANPTSGLVGHEVDVFADGADNNSQRIGVDIVGGIGVSTAPVIGYGIRIGPQNATPTNATFNEGIRLNGDMARGINFNSTFQLGIDLSSGTYSSGSAIRLPINNKIDFDSTGTSYLYSPSAGNMAMTGNLAITGSLSTSAGVSATGTINTNNATVFGNSANYVLNGGAATTSLRGIGNTVTFTPTLGTIGSEYGIVNFLTHNSANIPSNVFGVNSSYSLGASSLGGAITGVAQFNAATPSFNAASTTNISTYQGFVAQNVTQGSSQTISSVMGFRGQQASGTGRWNAYMDGTADNAFRGNTTFGAVTAPNSTADIVVSGDTSAAPYSTYNTLGTLTRATNTGTSGGYGNRLSWTQSGVQTSGFSIAQGILGNFANTNAQGQSLWMVAQSPLTSTGHTFGVAASEMNPINLYGVPTTFRSRGENTRWVGGIQLVPESNDLLTGGANKTSYPTVFAYAATHSSGLAASGKHQKTGNGLLMEGDSIYPGGSGVRASGLIQTSAVTGSISGNTLTISALASTRSQIYVGEVVTGVGVTPATIIADAGGNGGTGAYTIDGGAQTISSEALTLTAPLSDAPNEALRIEDYWMNGIYTVDATFSNNRAVMLGNGQYISSRNAANNADVDIVKLNAANNVQFGAGYGFSNLISSPTAPTIASGFGTTPSVVSNNGTATFNINVGTGGTASSGVVTMPAATTGWNCAVKPAAAPQADSRMDSAATSTTSITITNYTASTGAALAWPASTVIAVTCVGY